MYRGTKITKIYIRIGNIPKLKLKNYPEMLV